MVFSLWLWPTTKSTATKIYAKRWGIHLPCGYSSAMQGTLLDGVHPWLHAKPLDAKVSDGGAVNVCEGHRKNCRC